MYCWRDLCEPAHCSLQWGGGGGGGGGGKRHLPRVSDIDDVKQNNKNHETIPSIFFPEQKTKRSLVLRHLCPVHEALTEKPKFVGCKIRGMRS